MNIVQCVFRIACSLLLSGLLFACEACAIADEITPASASLLKLEVKTNKSVYVIGEPIIVSLKVTNLGTENIEDKWFSFGNNLDYRIETEVGEDKVPLFVYYSFIHNDITLWNRQLKPRSTVTTAFDVMLGDIIDVSPYYQRAEFYDFETGLVATHLTAGAYSIEVSHKLPKPLKGFMVATAKFQVRQPSEKEQAALKLFQKRPYEVINLKGRTTPPDAAEFVRKRAQALEECIPIYERLYRDYLRTPYAPYAQYYAGRLLQSQKKFDKALVKYETVLKSHPVFPLKADLLYYLSSSYLDLKEHEKARMVLQSLKNEFPDHLIAPTVTYLAEKSRIESLEARD